MKIKLSDYSTFNEDWNKEEIAAKTEKMLMRIGELQYKMYAQNKYSVLIVFQGMDASGKEGDWDTRLKFDEYLDVYEKIFNTCNAIPWNIVPADTNWQKLYPVAETVLKTLEEFDLKWPELVTEKFSKAAKTG